MNIPFQIAPKPRDITNLASDAPTDRDAIAERLLGHVVSVDIDASGYRVTLIYADGKRVHIEPLGWEADALGFRS